MLAEFLIEHVLVPWVAWVVGPTGVAAAWYVGRRIRRLWAGFIAEVRDGLRTARRVETRVTNIEEQLGNNGGRSLRDAVDRIGAAVSHISAAQMALTDAIPQPLLFADGAGECVHVNNAFEEMVGYGRAVMLERGWVASLHDDCRERVVEAWRRAVKDRRGFFNVEATFQHRDGYRIACILTAYTIARGRAQDDVPMVVSATPPESVTGWLLLVRVIRASHGEEAS